MGLDSYLYNIMEFLPHFYDINDESIKLLSYFISFEHLSIYQIHKLDTGGNKQVAYKTSHKRVQKLIKLGLIERIAKTSQLAENELERGAKYYKLSELGLFVLYLNYGTTFPRISMTQRGGQQDYLIDFSKSMMKRYIQYDFYEFFLFPWLNINTIELCSEKLIRKINTVLSDICIYVERLLRLNQLQNSAEMLFNLKFLREGTYNVEKNPFLFFLKSTFSLGNEKVKVKLEDKEIIVSSIENELILQLQLKKKEKEIVVFSLKQQKRITLPIILTTENDILVDISSYISQPQKHSLKLIFFKSIFSIIIEDIDEKDMKLLSRDSKFIEILSELNNQYKNNYKALQEKP